MKRAGTDLLIEQLYSAAKNRFATPVGVGAVSGKNQRASFRVRADLRLSRQRTAEARAFLEQVAELHYRRYGLARAHSHPYLLGGVTDRDQHDGHF